MGVRMQTFIVVFEVDFTIPQQIGVSKLFFTVFLKAAVLHIILKL